MTNRMAVLIHGLGSNTEKTWGDFPALLTKNPEIAGQYIKVEAFSYATGKVSATSSLSKIAKELAKWLKAEVKKNNIDEVAIITHSQGGLLARRYLCDELKSSLKSKQHLPIFRLLTFATPHWGAYSDNASKLFPDSREQQKDLAYDSEFILSLNKDWATTDAENIVRVKRVAAGDDKVVPEFSSTGANYNNEHEVMQGHGHIGFVKISDTTHPTFDVVKDFLLEESSAQPMLVNPDKTPPVLSCILVDDSKMQGNDRFSYNSRFLPLLGRDSEKAQLEQFLFSPGKNNVAWMLIKGQGGVGKSRMALELCLSMYADWHAGFLVSSADAPDWARWQPYLPTLLVIEHALTDTIRLRKLLQGLCCRDSKNLLRRPVRILLLDRPQLEDKLPEVLGHDGDKHILAACRWPDLDMLKIDNTWKIIKYFLTKIKKDIPDRTRTLEHLTRIDPAQRPLFAMLLADALGKNKEIGTLTQQALLENVIDEDRDKYWRPAALAVGVQLPELERLLAIATLVNGLSRNKVVDPIEKWNPHVGASAFQIISGYDKRTDTIAPLTPDLLGECFALESFKSFNVDELKEILRLAWCQWGRNAFAFFNRVLMDFPDDVLIDDAIESAPLDNVGLDSWSTWAVNVIGITGSQDNSRAGRVYLKLYDLATERSWLMRELAQATCNLISHLGVINLATAINIFTNLCALVKSHSHNSEIAIVPLDTHFSSLPHISQAAEQRKKELWICIGKAAKNLILALANAGRFSDAKKIYLQSWVLSAGCRHPREFGIDQATVARDLICILSHFDAREIVMEAFKKLCELADAATGSPYGLDIRKMQVLIALHTINANHDEPEIRLIKAKATYHAAQIFSAEDPEFVKVAIKNLSDMSSAYPSEPKLYELELFSAGKAMNELKVIDPEFCVELQKKYFRAIVENLNRYLKGT